MGLDRQMDRLERFEQPLHLGQGPGVGSIAQDLVGARVGLHEDPRIGERLFSLMKFRDGQWSLAFGGREGLSARFSSTAIRAKRFEPKRSSLSSVPSSSEFQNCVR